MIDYLKEIWRFRHVPITQAAVELKRGVRDTRLGPIWWVLDPILLMAVYYFVVQIIFDRGGPNYALFLLAGLVPYESFTKSMTACTASIKRNKGLVTQAKVPLFSLQIGTITTNLAYMGFGLAVVLVFGWRVPGVELIYLVPLVLAQALFTLAIGAIAAVVNVFIPDVQRLLPALIRAGRYVGPVLYSASRVLDSSSFPPLAKTLYQLNPFVTFLPGYRAILVDGVAPDLGAIGIWLCVSAVMAGMGLLMMKNMEGRVLKFV